MRHAGIIMEVIIAFPLCSGSFCPAAAATDTQTLSELALLAAAC